MKTKRSRVDREGRFRPLPKAGNGVQLLLIQSVDHVGKQGDVVTVKRGYALNYLLPQGLAIAASAGNKRLIEEQRRLLAKREKHERTSAENESEKLSGLELRFSRRVGEHGILYGSVTALDVAEALKEQGFIIERRKIGLREHIKEVGEYDVTIRLHRDVSPTIKVVVLKEGEEEIAPPGLAAEAEPTAAGASTESTPETGDDGGTEEPAPEE